MTKADLVKVGAELKHPLKGLGLAMRGGNAIAENAGLAWNERKPLSSQKFPTPRNMKRKANA